VSNRKRAAPVRGGDLVRVAWKPPGKASCRCLSCGWAPAAGIGYANVAREARAHTRQTGHVTRFAAVEVVEYRPLAPGHPG
jgi:hypothetical protein